MDPALGLAPDPKGIGRDETGLGLAAIAYRDDQSIAGADHSDREGSHERAKPRAGGE